MLQTAERISTDLSDNFVFQRSLLAYIEASKIVYGNVLEIGTGSGYGIDIICPKTSKFTTIDKFKNKTIEEKIKNYNNAEFIKMDARNLDRFESESFDFVVSFQVIEHIKNDKDFVCQIHRILKPGGKFIVSTPNIKMSLTRNPWHVREYTVEEFKQLLSLYFSHIDAKGVFGNEKIMQYYEKNKEAVKRITRFDILNLQYRLPRQLLQIPYDILNRINRIRLLKNNTQLVKEISYTDYYIQEANDNCFDLFYIATK